MESIVCISSIVMWYVEFLIHVRLSGLWKFFFENFVVYMHVYVYQGTVVNRALPFCTKDHWNLCFQSVPLNILLIGVELYIKQRLALFLKLNCEMNWDRKSSKLHHISRSEYSLVTDKPALWNISSSF